MSRRKISTTVYLTHEQDALLKLLSERTRVPVAEYIRLGIDLVLDANQKHLPGQIALFDQPVKQESSEGAVCKKENSTHS